jgi:proton-dependent oligopeptide transporter, POT family
LSNSASVSALDDRALFGQPRGLGLLFMAEMWERFSYYGMRALLILYLVNGLGWGTARAASLYGTYTMAVYLTPILGGFIADRWLGTRAALVLGGFIIAAGHFSMAVPSMATFYLGLTLIVIGTGFFKPNVSTMVGQLYPEGDQRRDSGFTIFYMGINIGAFIGPLICGYLAQTPGFGWHYGFAAAGVGMVLGLIMYLVFRDKYLPGIGLRRTAPSASTMSNAGAPRDADTPAEETRRIVALFIVAFFVFLFWLGYEQAGSSLNLFADKHTNLDVGGYKLRSSWFQSVPAFWVVVLAPAFAALWGVLRRRDREPSTPLKMTIGLGLLGVSFVLLVFAGRRADTGVLVSPLWLVVAYMFQVFGELCVSPVGLSYVTKVAPARFASLLMGVWFLSTSAASKVGGWVAGLLETIPSLSTFFMIFVVISFAACVFMLVLVPLLRRLTRSVRA